MLRPLYRPKSLTDFILCATSANIVVVPCKWTQHVGPNNVASVCMDLYTPRNKWIACVTKLLVWWIYGSLGGLCNSAVRNSFTTNLRMDRQLISPPWPRTGPCDLRSKPEGSMTSFRRSSVQSISTHYSWCFLLFHCSWFLQIGGYNKTNTDKHLQRDEHAL